MNASITVEGRSKVNFQLQDPPRSISWHDRIRKRRVQRRLGLSVSADIEEVAFARRVANEAGAEREAVTLIRIESRCEDLDSLEAQ